MLSKDGAQCVIESSNILRYAIEHRKEKKIYVYPADQAPYARAGKHFIGDFMHQPTNAMQGSVGLACKLSHAVLYVKMQRIKRGEYELSFVPICDNASLTTPEDLLRKYYGMADYCSHLRRSTLRTMAAALQSIIAIQITGVPLSPV